MSVTTGMREYLALVAEWLVNDVDGEEEENLRGRRDRLWAKMSQDEKDYLNGLMEDIFGMWL